MRALQVFVSGTVLFLLTAAGAAAQEPAKFFEDNCAVCHAIGGEPGSAPDLKGITARRDRGWLVRFILNAEETAKHDPVAAALVTQYDDVVMPPTEGATAETIEALLRYIDAASAASPPSPARAAATRVATDSDIALGRGLYRGQRVLAGRSPACVSCHRVDSIGALGGGTLGPDLTRVAERLGGARGLTAWLANPPTRVMRAVFRGRPLADEEVFAIGAMLASERPRAAPAAARPRLIFAASGVAAAAAALALMALVWSRRLIAVRRPLVQRARTNAGDEA